MSEKFELRFRYQTLSDSKYGVLFNYINEEKETSKQELILKSLSSLWMPFAYSFCDNISEKELKNHALFAIYKLKLHIILLCETFGLDIELIDCTNKSSVVDKVSENAQHISIFDESDNNEQYLDYQDIDHIFNIK